MSKILKNTAVIFLSSALLAVLIKLFLLQIYDNKADSTEQHVNRGEKLIINKISKGKLNDIILYEDSSDRLYVSRIIAKTKDVVDITKNDIYVNGKEFKTDNTLKEYCLRFINNREFEQLEKKYDIRPVNNSGTYKILLRSEEYNEIIIDSLSTISRKIFPLSECLCNFYESEETSVRFTVPKDFVFVLNDNRSNFNDSRTLGLISKKDIVGKVIHVY